MDYMGFIPSNVRVIFDQICTTKAQKSIAQGKLTFDERVVLHCVEW